MYGTNLYSWREPPTAAWTSLNNGLPFCHRILIRWTPISVIHSLFIRLQCPQPSYPNEQQRLCFLVLNLDNRRLFFIRKVKKFYGFVANIQVSSTRQMICLDRGTFPHYMYNLVFLWPSALNMKYIQHKGTWLKPGILWISIVDTHASTRCRIYCFRFARCCDSCLYEPEIIDTRLMADSS